MSKFFGKQILKKPWVQILCSLIKLESSDLLNEIKEQLLTEANWQDLKTTA